MWQDFRYGARVLRMSPGFFAVATLSLALGIGANTAIFELLNAVRLRLLPVEHPEQLAEVEIFDDGHCCNGNFSNRRPNFTFAQWEQIRDHQEAFSGIFAFGDHRFNLTESGETRYAEGLWVSGKFFSTLGVRPALGRMIAEEADQAGCGSPGVVLGYSFWQREFAGDPAAIGKKLSLDSHPVTVIGVAPSDFFGVEVGKDFDVFVPICAEAWIGGPQNHTSQRHNWWLAIIGRLKPGWTVERADAQVKSISPGVFESTIPPSYRPDSVKWYRQYKLTAHPAGGGVSELRSQYQKPLILLLGIAGLVLLIACANLANLTLARASTREREMAIRLAIGAGRGRLIRQLLTESLLLTIAGAALGALLARGLSSGLVAFLTTGSNRISLQLSPDWRVLAFTAIVTVATCMLFGLTPALKASRTSPSSAMRGRGLTADREKFGLRRALVVAQVALSLVLLVGALLFSGTLRNLMLVDAGLKQDGLVVAQIDITNLKYPAERREIYYRDLLAALRSTPGISGAATADIVPLSGNGWNDAIEFLDEKRSARMVPWFNRVSSGYFQTVDSPIIAGREFDERDTRTAPHVAVVNQEFCRKFLNGADPIGKQFRLLVGPGEPERQFTIVGVVKNSKYRNLREDFKPTAFVPLTQDRTAPNGTNVLIRSSLPAGMLLPKLKSVIQDANPGTLMEFAVFKKQVEETLLPERLMATLSGFFGALAAILATVGLYGVVSYMVAKRRNEIGIRIALGAGRSDVIRLVLREAALLVAIGVVAGAAISIAAARTTASMLYGLKPVIGGGAMLLAAVGIAASFIPSMRASRVEPMSALRED
jgi:predicted permease